MTPNSRAARTFAPLVLPLLAALCLASCGAGAAPTAAASAPATAVVHVRDFGFQPGSVTVRRGGTVTWINEDDVDHTTTADSGSWDSGTLGRGQHFSRRFEQDGTFRYHCAFHAFMTGTVRVVGGT